MKQRIIALITLVVAVSLLGFGTAKALDLRSGQSPIVDTTEDVDSTLFIAGNSVTVAGHVRGDVFCGAQTVSISGVVDGDVICGASQLEISGQVHGDVRVGASAVSIFGRVDGSVTAGAASITIGRDAVVGRDLTAGAADLTILGKVHRDVLGGSATVLVTGSVGRDVQVETESITLGTSSSIGGNLTYYSQNEVQLNSGAMVAGKTQRFDPPEAVRPTLGQQIMAVVFGFSTMLALGLVLFVLTPRLLAVTAQKGVKSSFAAFGIGVLGLVVPPFVALLLAMTIVGLLATAIVILLWVVLLLTGAVFGANALGQLLAAKLQVSGNWRSLFGLLLGVLVVFLVSLIPFVGWLGFLAAMVWGIGSLLMVAFANSRTKKPASQKA